MRVKLWKPKEMFLFLLYIFPCETKKLVSSLPHWSSCKSWKATKSSKSDDFLLLFPGCIFLTLWKLINRGSYHTSPALWLCSWTSISPTWVKFIGSKIYPRQFPSKAPMLCSWPVHLFCTHSFPVEMAESDHESSLGHLSSLSQSDLSGLSVLNTKPCNFKLS